MVRHSIICSSLALILSLVAAASSQAALVTTRAGLGGTDFIDWGQFGSSLTVVTDPVNGTTNLGLDFSLNNPNGDLERRDQGSGWSGNFAPGDELIWTANTPGPIVIDFISPVSAIGAQIQRDQFGRFTGTIAVYDSANALLETYDLAGLSNASAHNSAIFLGISRTLADIDRVEFNVSASADFAINQVDIVSGSEENENEIRSIPEPASLTLLGIGLAGLGVVRRKQRT